VYRYLLLGAHYRTQVDFDLAALDGKKTALRRLLERLPVRPTDEVLDYRRAAALVPSPAARAYLDEFDAAVSADLNTARALAVVAAAAGDDELSNDDLSALAGGFDAVLGLGLGELQPPDLELARSGVDVSDVQRLFAERLAARAAKDWARSDALREKLADMGVEVQDTADGSTWSWR
jgi:cysteinyl-tRNA synthetase